MNKLESFEDMLHSSKPCQLYDLINGEDTSVAKIVRGQQTTGTFYLSLFAEGVPHTRRADGENVQQPMKEDRLKKLKYFGHTWR